MFAVAVFGFKIVQGTNQRWDWIKVLKELTLLFDWKWYAITDAPEVRVLYDLSADHHSRDSRHCPIKQFSLSVRSSLAYHDQSRTFHFVLSMTDW